jgi:hypothetical protein
MYRWIVLTHVLFVLAFVLFHGSSVVALWKLRRERVVERVKVILELSAYPFIAAYLSLFLVVVTGVVLGFMGGWWARGWIWAALGLLVVVFVAMGAMGSGALNRLREELGLPSSYGQPSSQPDRPADPERVAALLNRLPVWPITAIGAAGLVLFTWLMMLKPF